MLVYEIPVRTGSRMTIDTIRKVLDLDGVIGLKDSTGGLDLLLKLTQYETKPVLCGEDAYFHAMLCQGAAGGMLASAHLNIQKYVDIYQRFVAGDMNGSRDNFMLLESVIQHVFAEPAPAAIKWWLTQQEIIAAEQLRLPLMPLSDQVKQGLLNSIVS